MSTQEQAFKKLEEIRDKSGFNLFDHMFLSEDLGELSQFQKENIKKAISILEKNIVGEVKYFKGDLSQSSEKLEKFIEDFKNNLESEEDEEYREALQNLSKKYIKVLKELIEKTCYAIIPVKEMPWKDVLFRTVPKIEFIDEKIQIYDNIISFYGEIDTTISKTTIFGKIKNEKPLFAPVMGDIELDIDQSRENIEQGTKKVYNFSYTNAIINALETKSIQTHLTRYHEGYQRHGEPICDFLMNKNDLMTAMNNLISGIESGRLKTTAAVCAIALPDKEQNNTIILTLDERDTLEKFEKCFEAVLRFSAACYEAPQAEMISSAPQEASLGSQPTSAQEGGAMRTPGGQELKVWTAQELAEEAEKRKTSSLPEGVEAWNEEDLKKLTEQRNKGIPEGMEVWSEEELQELAKKRQGGGLDIPEWKPDEDMIDCPNCGYTLRKDWAKDNEIRCPHCDYVVRITDEEEE
jgi:hypothetical protein